MLTPLSQQTAIPCFSSLLILSSLQILEGSCWYLHNCPACSCRQLIILNEVCLPPPLQMWKISEFTKKESGWGDKGAEWPVTSWRTWAHRELTQHLQVHTTGTCHTHMMVLGGIFSSEVMVETADSPFAELLLLVYTGYLMFLVLFSFSCL